VRVTQSLCPACYRLLPAAIFEKEERLYIRKICPEHGEFEDLYYGDWGCTTSSTIGNTRVEVLEYLTLTWRLPARLTAACALCIINTQP